MPQQPDLEAILKRYGGTIAPATPAPITAGADLDAILKRYGGTIEKAAPVTLSGPYQPLIEKYSAEFGVDPTLVQAVMKAESAGKPGAVSPKGAQGLMQLMPATAKQYGVTDPTNPDQNIRAGVQHLKWLLDRFGGDETKAVAAYNAGHVPVEQYGGIPPFPETQAYVPRVMEGRGGPKPPAFSAQTPGAVATSPVKEDWAGAIKTAAPVIAGNLMQQPALRITQPVVDVAQGIAQGTQGVAQLAQAGAIPGLNTAMGTPLDPLKAAVGVTNTLQGTAGALTPMVAGTMAAQPGLTAITLTTAALAKEAGVRAGQHFKFPPEVAEMIGEVAAATVLGAGVHRFVGKMDAKMLDLGKKIGEGVKAREAAKPRGLEQNVPIETKGTWADEAVTQGYPARVAPQGRPVAPAAPPVAQAEPIRPVAPPPEVVAPVPPEQRPIPPTVPEGQWPPVPVEPPVELPPAAQAPPPALPPVGTPLPSPMSAAVSVVPSQQGFAPRLAGVQGGNGIVYLQFERRFPGDKPVTKDDIRTMFPGRRMTIYDFEPNGIRNDIQRFRLDIHGEHVAYDYDAADEIIAELGGKMHEWNRPEVRPTAFPELPPPDAAPPPPAEAAPPPAATPEVQKVSPQLSEHDAYITQVLGYGRKEMLRLIHSGGLKVGTGQSDADLAETLWRHWGSKRKPVPEIPGVQALRIQKKLAAKRAEGKAAFEAKKTPPLTYEQFAEQYQAAYAASNKYTPNEVGSQVFMEKMAKLADDYPEFEARLQAELEAKAAPQEVAPAPEAVAPEPVLEPQPEPVEVAPPVAEEPAPVEPSAPSFPAIPDIPWQGPSQGSGELASLKVRHRTLSERDKELWDKKSELEDKLKKTSSSSKLSASLMVRIHKINAERESFQKELEEVSKAGYDANLQVALADPATPPEVRLAVADAILRRRKQRPTFDAYESLKAEAERRLLEIGSTPEEAQAEAARLSSRLLESPLYEGSWFDKSIANSKQLITERRALQADLDAYDALEAKYGKSTGYVDYRKKLKDATAGSRKQYLADAEEQLKADKERRDKEAKERAESQALEDAEAMNEAQVWAAKGQLVYRRVKGDTVDKWVPTKGERVEIPEIPDVRFWLSRVNGEWIITEEQSGLSAFSGSDKAEVLEKGVERIVKHKDKLAGIVAKEMQSAPPKPALQNYEKPVKAKKAARVVARRTTEEQAPEPLIVDTPEEAAAIVKEEIKHVIDTTGLPSAKAIQEKVLSTLSAELAGAEKFQAALTLGQDIYGKAIDAARKTVGDRPPNEDYNAYSKRLREAEAAVKKPSFLNANGTITIEIPGDGIFTIKRDPQAIRTVMKRISSMGAKAWQGLDPAVVHPSLLNKRQVAEAGFYERQKKRSRK